MTKESTQERRRPKRGSLHEWLKSHKATLIVIGAVAAAATMTAIRGTCRNGQNEGRGEDHPLLNDDSILFESDSRPNLESIIRSAIEASSSDIESYGSRVADVRASGNEIQITMRSRSGKSTWPRTVEVIEKEDGGFELGMYGGTIGFDSEIPWNIIYKILENMNHPPTESTQ